MIGDIGQNFSSNPVPAYLDQEKTRIIIASSDNVGYANEMKIVVLLVSDFSIIILFY